MATDVCIEYRKRTVKFISSMSGDGDTERLTAAGRSWTKRWQRLWFMVMMMMLLMMIMMMMGDGNGDGGDDDDSG